MTFLCAVAQFVSVPAEGVIRGLPALPAAQACGLAAMALGLLLFVAAMRTMRDNWRAGYNEEQNTELVTNGIYRYSRNPAFLGFDCLYTGCALVFPNFLNIAFASAAIIMLHLQILGEEKFLAAAFGRKYAEYAAVTARYFGRKRGL